jgi:hypothetical protein
MDANAAQPALTGIEVAAHALGALCYLAVGVPALVRAPRDARTRVFFGMAVLNLVTFAVTLITAARGYTDPTTMPRQWLALMLATFAVAALLLFHFTQVFPRQRPWLKTSGIQMAIGYVLAPAVIVVMVWFWPGSIQQLTVAHKLGFLVFGFPLAILLAFVLPIAAVVSLVRSYREALTMRWPVAKAVGWILASQVFGSLLGLLFAPVVVASAPGSPAATLVILLVAVLGLLTPLAFAAAVWRFRLLELPPD